MRCDYSSVSDGVVLVVENERWLVALVTGVSDHALEMTSNIARCRHELDLEVSSAIHSVGKSELVLQDLAYLLRRHHVERIVDSVVRRVLRL